MFEKEKNKKDKKSNSQQLNINNDTKNNSFSDIEEELDKEDPNFDSIDFNINPFNNNIDKTNKEKDKESEDLFLVKEEEKIKINNNDVNLKINNVINALNNPQINISPGYTNINNTNNYFSNVNYNNNVLNNNYNLYNVIYDLKAAPFLPKNININQNINKLNINNDLLQSKGRQSWICSICQNFNSKSEQFCNRCGNINNNLQGKYCSSSNLPFVFPFENNKHPLFSPANSNVAECYISNSKNEQTSNQNEKILFSKNTKKNKKPKKNNNQKHGDKRPFDWICNRCNNLNYSFRTFCNLCYLPKSQNIFYNKSNRNSK